MQDVNMDNRLLLIMRSLRVNQWIKNLVVFTAIIFSGELFNQPVLIETIGAFFIFCLLSSTSYVFNDIIDYPNDKKHPIKRFRPIASGKISIQEATFTVFINYLSRARSYFLCSVFSHIGTVSSSTCGLLALSKKTPNYRYFFHIVFIYDTSLCRSRSNWILNSNMAYVHDLFWFVVCRDG